MADKKISQLTSATTPLAGTEVLPIVQSSTTVKVAVSDLTAGRSVSATQFTPTGGTATGNGMYLPAANALGLITNATERMRIDASGNVGIGMAPNSAQSTVQIFNAIGTTVNAALRITDNATTSLLFGTTASTVASIWSSGALTFGTNNATITERMRIDVNGNVGIGTNNPTSKLYVSGGVTTSVYGLNTLYSSAGSEFQAPAANGIHLDTDGWANATVISSRSGTVAATRSTYGLILTSTYGSSSYSSAAVNINCATGNGAISFYTGTGSAAPTEQFKVHDNGNALVLGAGGLGYGTGSGGAVTQATSRTTGVTLDKTNGAITLVSAAGTTTWQSFTVTNNKVAATDTVIVNQKSGTDLYQIFVTNVAAGSFKITFATTGGTTTEQPVFNFALIKAVTS